METKPPPTLTPELREAAAKSSRALDATSAPLLTPELIEAFRRVGIARNYAKDTIIVMAGESAESMFIVLEGSLLVYLDDESGKVAELRRLGPGEYFGELMLGATVRSASVRSLTPAKLCIVKRNQCEEIIAERPDLAFHVIQTLIKRVQHLTDTVGGLILLDVYGRLARLFNQAAPAASGQTWVIELSQQAMAEKVGASVAMINRILHDLAAGGYITVSRGRIEVNKPLPRRW